jgi:hypothetical protein
LNQLVDACNSGTTDACTQAKQVIATRTELAKQEIQSCARGSYDCIGMYQPSAREVADALRQLPGAGSGATTSTADPITAAVLVRMGFAAPSTAFTAATIGGASEWLNQTLYGDGTTNYERMANAAFISWASGGAGSALSSYPAVMAWGGATNGAITAYNNSQSDTNDSIAGNALLGVAFSGGGKLVGDSGGNYLNGVMNYTKKLDQKLAALLQPPGGYTVPVANPSNFPWFFRSAGNGVLPGFSGAFPSIPVSAAGDKK